MEQVPKLAYSLEYLRRNEGVGDVVQRVGCPCVLGDGGVLIVDDSVLLVKNHVLDNRSKLDRVENLRLLLASQVDRLGVATALDVEDTWVCVFSC